MSRYAPLFPLPLLSMMACSAGTSVGTDVGVTAGGAQDIGLAREIVEAGFIPGSESYTAEGLISEHDLPLVGLDCSEALCPRGAAATVEPLDGRGTRMLVQLGFGTRFDQEGFSRGPLDLALAVDVSGSMAGSKIEATRDALHTLADELDAEDSVSLVAFDDRAEVRLPVTVMDAEGRDRLHAEIDRLQERGSTNIEAGLSLAYAQISDLGPDADGLGQRVMLFTDALPNVGATGTDSFVHLARVHADMDIGLTVLGLGLDLGTELATAMSEVRGGNHFTLLEAEDIRTVFDEDFDYIVTPVAYDLDVEILPAASLHVETGLGAPVDETTGTVRFGVSTLFFSRSNGGLGVLLAPDDEVLEALPDDEVVHFVMSYEQAADGVVVERTLSVAFDGGESWIGDVYESAAADDEGVYKMAAVVDVFDALRAGSAFCEGSLDGGVAADRMKRALDRVEAADAELGDQSFADERYLLSKLRANLSHGATRCF